MKFTSHAGQLGILVAGAFFSFAPAWVPYIQQVPGRNLFVTPDSMVLLGVTLLVSLLGAYLLPGFFVKGTAILIPSSLSQGDERGRGVSRAPYVVRLMLFTFALLALIGVVFILYWVNQRILHSFLSSADEHSCYFLAECLRKGKLYVDIPPLADFFKVVHVGMKGGKWFSVYPLGWPLIWAFGLNFNIVDWLNPVMSAISVLFFYLAGAKLFGRRVAVLGLVIMCLNPFFMFTAAAYFSHATCFLCMAVFFYAFLKWREGYETGRDPVGWAFLCALAVGYGLMTRYLTMAAVAGPFLLHHYLPIFFDWKGFRKRSPSGSRSYRIPFALKCPRLRKSDWIAIGVIGVFVALILWQNYLVTGKVFKAPNKYDKSWERLGFRKDYTPVDGLFFLIARVFYLMDWFAPAIVGIYLFLILNLRNFKSSSPSGTDPGQIVLRNLFCLTMVFIVVAYFFYYSWGGNQWGPRYLWEGMPFLCIAVTNWLICRWQEGSLRIRKFLFVFVLASLVTSGILFFKQAQFTEEASRQRRALYDLAVKTIGNPAIVFIHSYLGDRLVLAEEDAVRNSPFLDGRILYAHDLGDRNKELMAAYPGREYYRGTYDRRLLRARLEKINH